MIMIYSGSGSGEIIEEGIASQEEWEMKKEQIIRLLQARNQKKSIELLRRRKFLLLNGTNYFNDEFRYLQTELSAEEYVDFEVFFSATENKTIGRNIADALSDIGFGVRFIIAKIEEHQRLIVETPIINRTSSLDVLKGCLASAESDIRNGNHVYAVDRLHTAMHAYLLDRCRATDIDTDDKSTIMKLLKQLKGNCNNHNIEKILTGCGNLLDSMNNIRNHNSLSHPNESLLDEADALFYTNVAKSIMTYLESKL